MTGTPAGRGKETTALESWSCAGGAQCQGLAFSPEKCLKMMTSGNKNKKKHLCWSVMMMRMGTTQVAVFAGWRFYCCFDEGSLQSLVRNFFLFCSFIKVLCVLEWQGCVCVCEEGLWAVWVGWASAHTHTHTRTRDQRQSGSHPCLPLICVPRPACPRGAAPYHARWHHAHQRLPTTVWER